MSIILKALKKIQNLEAQASQKASARSAEEEQPAGDAADAKSPADRKKPWGLGLLESPLRKIGVSGQRMPFSVKFPPPSQWLRFSGTPKILLALIVALGIVTTGWFVSRIYVNLKNAGVEDDTAAQASAEQPQEMAKAAAPLPPPHAPISQKAPAPAAEPPQAKVAAAPPKLTASPQPAAPPAAVSAPELVEDEPQKIPPTDVAPHPVRTQSAQPQPAQVVPAQAGPAVKEVESQKKERPELKINAIAWKAQEPRAIVNMERVYVGDVIDGALVKEIRRKTILFEYDGEEFEVRF